MHWYGISKCDRRGLFLASRHYTKQKAIRELGPLGQKIILLTNDSLALWGSHRPASWANISRLDGYDAHNCFIFRNEGTIVSSLLIREAIRITRNQWGIASQGFITYVAKSHVRSTNPGYCFLQAGFQHEAWVDSRKLGTLRLLIMCPDEVARC